MDDIEVLQNKIGEDIKQYLRNLLGEDTLNGNIQVVTIITNKITGRLDINSCNVELQADIKKLLREGVDMIERQRLVMAILSTATKSTIKDSAEV